LLLARRHHLGGVFHYILLGVVVVYLQVLPQVALQAQVPEQVALQAQVQMLVPEQVALQAQVQMLVPEQVLFFHLGVLVQMLVQMLVFHLGVLPQVVPRLFFLLLIWQCNLCLIAKPCYCFL
jgi:hypothetical protein